MLVHEIMDRAQFSGADGLAMLDFDWNRSKSTFQHQINLSAVGGTVVGVLAGNPGGSQPPQDLLDAHPLP